MKSSLKFAALFGAVTLGLTTSGCNTMEGFGRDLTAAGTALSGAAGKDEKKAPQTPQPAAAPAPAPAPAQPAAAPAPAPAPQRR